MLLDNNEPTSYGEAMVGPDSDEWLEAIKIRERIHAWKARLVIKMFSDKFKELTTMKLSHS